MFILLSVKDLIETAQCWKLFYVAVGAGVVVSAGVVVGAGVVDMYCTYCEKL